MITPKRLATGVALLLALVVGAMAGSTVAKKGQTVQMAMATSARPMVTGRVGLTTTFAPVVKMALPAVVNISSLKVVKTNGQGTSPFFNDPFFQQFFGNQFHQFNMPRTQREQSLGSGVIVNSNGYILTNNHVVDGATEIKVSLADKREFTAKIVGRDPKTDIAVLKVDATNLPVLPAGDSSKLEVGDVVLAIGSPFGLNQTVTMGIVSAVGRGGLGIEDYEDFIQTDAAINPGNSGGALINAQGELIGINTAILSGGGGGNEGVGFAVPVNMAHEVMDQIMEHGKVIRGYLGAYIQDVTPSIAKVMKLPADHGALLSQVTPGGPAAKAGLAAGDAILAMDGKPVTDMRDLRFRVAMTAPNTTVKLEVVHDGVTKEVPVTLGELPSGSDNASAGTSGGTNALSGVSVDDMTPQIANQLGLAANTQGVVVTNVDQGSTAYDAGLRRGDVIQQVNRKPVLNVTQYQSAMQAAGTQPVMLLVNRGGNTMFLVIDSR